LPRYPSPLRGDGSTRLVRASKKPDAQLAGDPVPFALSVAAKRRSRRARSVKPREQSWGFFHAIIPGTHRIHLNICAMSKIPRLLHKDGAQ
jgi:hypothetical protein